jgi:hypothetical protein
MPADARRILAEIIEHAVEGCLRHRVREDYTNIALMNAANLILLGEAMDKPAVAAEGQARLDRVVTYTFLNGTHEYVSPTYYGVNLDVLLTLERFCRSERATGQTRALLELFWTDIAANYHPACGKLTGTRSRDYDYLRGLGILDNHLALAGWIDDPRRGSFGLIWPLLGEWQIPAEARTLSSTFPRTVRQSWGPADEQTRTNHLLPNIALSTSGAYYGGWMDLPLTVDFAGPREGARCYFIPDGRQDPYGKVKIPVGGGHSKTHHLSSFFAAVQRKAHAAAIVVYRQKDIPADCASLQSHFVMPFEADGFEIAGRRIALRQKEPQTVELNSTDTLILRRGPAAMSLRIPLARGLDGQPAKVSLVHDANAWGAVRLTIDHGDPQKHPPRDGVAMASFLVQIAEGPFRPAAAKVVADDARVRFEATTPDGPLVIEAKTPFAASSEMQPLPPKATLEVNGEDLGRRILGRVEPARTITARQAAAKPVSLLAGKLTRLEPRTGLVLPSMAIDADGTGTPFVWIPGEPGGRGSPAGSATWTLIVPNAGRYYVWARVQTPTPDDDSFYITLKQGLTRPLPRTDWHLGTRSQWTWVPLLGPDRKPLSIDLAAGEASLELAAREDGAKVNALCITTEAAQRPE